MKAFVCPHCGSGLGEASRCPQCGARLGLWLALQALPLAPVPNPVLVWPPESASLTPWWSWAGVALTSGVLGFAVHAAWDPRGLPALQPVPPRLEAQGVSPAPKASVAPLVVQGALKAKAYVHTVGRGESLSSIRWRYDLQGPEAEAWWAAQGGRALREGEGLALPLASRKATGWVVRVKAGDTLGQWAQRLDLGPGGVARLQALNPGLERPEGLRAGDRLFLPWPGGQP